MKSVPQLRTERLLLRGIEECDTDVIVELRSAPEIYKYFIYPHKITKEEHLNWLRNSYLNDNNRYDWIALKSQNNRIDVSDKRDAIRDANGVLDVIGIFGVKRNFDEVEISYLLSSKHYRKGYATEAINEIIRFTVSEWHIRSVIANVHKQNSASIKFIERLGFVVREGHNDRNDISNDETNSFICYEKKVTENAYFH